MAKMAKGRRELCTLVKSFIPVLCKEGIWSKESGVQLSTPRPAYDSGKRTSALIWMNPPLGYVPHLHRISFFLSGKWMKTYLQDLTRLSLNC